MTLASNIYVSKLTLNPQNPRYTELAKNEQEAIFWNIEDDIEAFNEMIESLYNIGFSAGEGNIVVVQDEKGKFSVRDGNRRVSALKLLLGKLKMNTKIKSLLSRKTILTINSVTPAWKKSNQKVSCSVETPKESSRIMKKLHTSGGTAKKKDWSSIDKARFICNESGIENPCLKIIEKFLGSAYLKKRADEKTLVSAKSSRTGNPEEKAQKKSYSVKQFRRNFSFVVFEEAVMPKYLSATGLNINQLEAIYPDAMQEGDSLAFEELIVDIGLGNITTQISRKWSTEDLRKRNVKIIYVDPSVLIQRNAVVNPESQGEPPSEEPNDGTASSPSNDLSSVLSKPGTKKRAYCEKINELDSLAKQAGHSKLEQCLKELAVMLTNKSTKNRFPIAACLLIRTCLEVSARYFSKKNGITYEGKTLNEILTEIKKYLESKKLKEIPSIIAGKDNTTSLNKIVHHLTIIPLWEEVEIHFNNVQPLCCFFLDDNKGQS